MTINREKSATKVISPLTLKHPSFIDDIICKEYTYVFLGIQTIFFTFFIKHEEQVLKTIYHTWFI